MDELRYLGKPAQKLKFEKGDNPFALASQQIAIERNHFEEALKEAAELLMIDDPETKWPVTTTEEWIARKLPWERSDQFVAFLLRRTLGEGGKE
jgi:hypothetical protein